MALNTINTYLLTGTGSGTLTYTKLVDIKDYSDIYGDKEQLEVTTLSDDAQKFIGGVKQGDSMTFTCNYTYEDFEKVKALDDGTSKHLRVAFGKGASGSYGTDGHFSFDGYVGVKVVGKGVNEVREMQITLIIESDIVAGKATA